MAMSFEGVDDAVQVIGEQCSVGIQSDLGRLMTKHPLHDFHVGPNADRERRSCMPQIVGRHSPEGFVGCLGALDRPGEPSRSRIAGSKVAALLRVPKAVFLAFPLACSPDRGIKEFCAATELHDLLEAAGASVWFSEKDIVLGQPFLREIDRGLAKSRTGLVLVTPALLKRIDGGGVSDKELSALLARDLLIPVVHGTT